MQSRNLKLTILRCRQKASRNGTPVWFHQLNTYLSLLPAEGPRVKGAGARGARMCAAFLEYFLFLFGRPLYEF